MLELVSHLSEYCSWIACDYHPSRTYELYFLSVNAVLPEKFCSSSGGKMISEHLKGLKCFVPCRRNYLDGKKPSCPNGEDWNKHLLNYEQANEWISKCENIGLCLGLGLIAIDVDNPKLLEFLKIFPETYTESTPSGGLHLVFKYDGK